jgi:hypothetical protein
MAQHLSTSMLPLSGPRGEMGRILLALDNGPPSVSADGICRSRGRASCAAVSFVLTSRLDAA